MLFSYNRQFSHPKQNPKPPSPMKDRGGDPTKPDCSKRTPAMDPEIWSGLPEEILELVLSLLPLKTFFNLRSTCKRFNSLVFSPSFASKHSSSADPSLSSFLLLSHPQFQTHFELYDSALATWRDLSLSLSHSHPTTTLLSASSGGLLCFSLPASASFLLCNVLSKSSRVVEFPFRPFSFHSLSLIPAAAGAGSSGYVLFALSSSGRAFLYDSATGSWGGGPGVPGPVPSDGRHDRGVFFRGRVWVTTGEPVSVAWFDLERREWGRPEAEMPGEAAFVRLVSADDGGRLMMVGGVGGNGIARSVRVWELNAAESEWVEISRVPETMCQKFMSVCYHNYHHVYCFWHRGTVCVCCYTWPEILYYKSSRSTWHWLPKCPSLPEKWSCGFRWFSFVPDLYALV